MKQDDSMPQISRVIWEQAWHEEVCVKIPFDGRQCVGITAAVRLIEDNGYFVELQLFGGRQRFEIANVCYPVLTVGIGNLTVCTSNLQINAGQLVSVKISVDGCVGTKIGPINVQKCWKLFDQDIHFFHFDSKEAGLTGVNKEEIISGYNDIAYIDNPSDSNDAPSISRLEGCWVTLYADENFEGDSITLNGPAEFSNLKHLPGATDDWGDRAGSLRTGPNTWVKLFNDEDFKDDNFTFGPGSTVRKLPNDDDTDSLKIFNRNPEGWRAPTNHRQSTSAIPQ